MAITDNFNRASLGSDWQTVLGAAWRIAGNTVAAPVSQVANTAMRRAEGNFPDDQYAEAKCQASGASWDALRGGVAVRMDGSGNCYYFLLGVRSSEVYKRVAGVVTALRTVSFTVVEGTLYTVRLTVTGDSLAVLINGVSYGTNTDSSLLTGKPGLYAVTGISVPSFDDFACTDAVADGGGGGGGSVPRAGLLGVG